MLSDGTVTDEQAKRSRDHNVPLIRKGVDGILRYAEKDHDVEQRQADGSRDHDRALVKAFPCDEIGRYVVSDVAVETPGKLRSR